MTASVTRTLPRRSAGLAAGVAIAAAAVAASLLVPAVLSSGRTGDGRPPGVEREPVSQLIPVAGSGVGGTVRVRALAGDKATVSLTVTGLRPGVTYVAQLHAGPPGAPSSSSGRLGELIPAPDGRATLTAGEARFGAAGASATLTFHLLTDGDHSIAIVAPGVGPVATTLLKPK